ncbi:hypothetical protein [Pseudomonas laurylsulfatiphila]
MRSSSHGKRSSGGDFITTGCPTTARRGRRTLCCDFARADFAEYPLLQKSLIRRLDLITLQLFVAVPDTGR